MKISEFSQVSTYPVTQVSYTVYCLEDSAIKVSTKVDPILIL
jgi:hypothetical protein